MAANPHVDANPLRATACEGFFDPATGTVSYLVWERASRQAAVIDPVLDYDFKSAHTGTRSLDPIVARIAAEALELVWILETHAHADHLSGARHLQERLGGKIAIGRHICRVQETFRDIYRFERSFLPDGSQFDRLLDDGETLVLGATPIEAMAVPGHTPADMAYRVDGSVFAGDTLFMPDVGTARADFPGGDAHQLYASIRRLLDLPPETLVHVCHDYPPPQRGPRWTATVAEQRAANIHVRDGIDEASFVLMRRARDATLDVPTLILPSIQVNVRAGHLPAEDEGGGRFLRIPLNALPLRAG